MHLHGTINSTVGHSTAASLLLLCINSIYSCITAPTASRGVAGLCSAAEQRQGINCD